MNRFFLVVVLASCAPVLSLTNAPCPCASGWTCCPGAQLCVLEQDACPGVRDDDAGQPSDAGADGGSATDCGAPLCTVGATKCSAAPDTRTQTCGEVDGCPGWVAAACGPATACWLGACRCEGPDCVRIDQVSPGPYFEGEWLLVDGRNFGISTGSSLTELVMSDGGVFRINALPLASNERLRFQLPWLGVGRLGDDVLLRIQSPPTLEHSRADWRTLRIYPAPQGGGISTIYVGHSPDAPTAGTPFRMVFRLEGRARGDVDVFVHPVLFIDGRQQFPSFAVFDEAGTLVPGALTVPEAKSRTVSVVVTALPAGAWLELAVGVDSSVGAQLGSGLLHLDIGLPSAQPPTAFEIEPASIEAFPTGASLANGYRLEVSPALLAMNLSHLLRTSEVATYTWNVSIIPADAGWSVRNHPQDPLSFGVTAEQLATGTPLGSYLRLQVLRDSPDAGAAEVVWTVTSQSGSQRELRYLLQP